MVDASGFNFRNKPQLSWQPVLYTLLWDESRDAERHQEGRRVAD